jgi:addiction module HigA family antidote
MIPKNRVPTHPGEVLLEEFLRPLGISQVRFARHLGIPLQRVNEIIRGKRGVTPETAWLLAQALSTSPEFWVNLQSLHDLAASRPSRKVATLRQAGWRGAARRVAGHSRPLGDSTS